MCHGNIIFELLYHASAPVIALFGVVTAAVSSGWFFANLKERVKNKLKQLW